MYGPIRKFSLTLTASGLFAFFLAVCLPLAAHATTLTPSGDIIIDGLVAGPPPSTPPTIEEPTTGTTFTEKSITVQGTCIADLIVRIYRNNFFAGSTLCQSDGTYSLSIDLFLGRNDLFARQFDSIGQGSPVSNTVTVYFTQPSPTPPLPDDDDPAAPPDEGEAPGQPDRDGEDIAQFQLIIDYDYTLQTIFINQPFYLPIKFVGGSGPYAVSIDWGDGTTDVFSRETTAQFTVDHIYKKAGFFTVTIKVSDKNGDKASLQFVLLVNGEEKPSFFTQPLARGNFGWWWALLATLVVIGWAIAFTLGRKSSQKKRKNQ